MAPQPFLICTGFPPSLHSCTGYTFRYGIDPCTGIGRDACERHVLGGGAALWDTDPSEVIAKSFPNAAVVAEALWSGEWSSGGGNDGDDGGGGGSGGKRGNWVDGHVNGNGIEDGDGDGDGSEGRWAEAELRLARFRCALGERGVAAGPVKITSAHFGSCAA